MQRWSGGHEPGRHGAHAYSAEEYGLDAAWRALDFAPPGRKGA